MAANDLLVTIDASTEGLRRQLGAADAAVAKFDKTTKASLGQIDSTMRKVDQSFNSLNKGASGFSRFGGAAQQAGYQIGDFATQIAGGQNALVALTQQLGQLLGAFGTAGAVLGAAAAIAGAVAVKFVDTRSATEKLNDGLKKLQDQLEASNALLKETESGLTAVAEAFVKADEFQKQLIRSNLEETIRKGSKAIRDQADAVKELTAAQGLFSTINGPGGRPSTQIGILSPAEGLSREQAFRASEAMRAFEDSDGGLKAAQDFAKALIDIRKEVDGASPAFTEFADTVLKAVEESVKQGKSLESLRKQLENLSSEALRSAAAIKVFIAAATEMAEVERKARLAASDRSKALLDDRDKFLAGVDREVAQQGKLAAAISGGSREYAIAAKQIEIMNQQTLIGADAARTLAARIVDAQAAVEASRMGADLSRDLLLQRDLSAAVDQGAEAFARAKDGQTAYLAIQRLGLRETDARAKSIRRLILELGEEQRITKARQDSADMADEIKHLEKLTAARSQGALAVAQVLAERKAELAVQALAIAGNTAEAQSIRDRVKELVDAQRQDATKERLVALQSELEFQGRLAGAYYDGERAVAAMNVEREIQLELQKLGISAYSAEGEALAGLIRQLREQERENKLVEKSIKELSDFAERAFDRIGSAITEAFAQGKAEAIDFGSITRAIMSEIVQEAIKLSLINPFKNWAFGQANPTLGSVFSAVSGPTTQAAGGGMPGGINPLSFVNTQGLYNQFAFSGLGQSLGLSTAYGGLGAVAGVSSATPAATLALSGPAGGMGTVAGLSTASTGGTAAAAGLGGATAPALTGLGAAMPYIGIALAGLALFSGMFQGNPSVGPVGVADFSPGLGRRNAFDVDGIDPFTADNGGNGESLRPIAEAIADLIADSADRFSATIDESLRFRVANYQGPEKGSGRASGFEVNAFINQEAEKRVAEGLTQEQAVFEAFKFAIQEAFTFDSATIAEAAANTAATTTEEILADLDFAKNFEALGQALENLGGTVDANTLALAQQTLAIQKQAEDFATANAQPILDAFEKARELFPATRSGEETRRITERGVFVNEGEGQRDRRFVEEGTDEFDRLTSGSDPLRVVTRIRTVTEEVDTQAENYAANMERMRQASEIANASVELLVDQVTGEFEPAVRGPFQAALEQGQANLEELATYFDDLNEQITDANEAFPGLNAALIDTNTVITDAMAALREQLQQDFTDSIQRQMNAAQGLGGINVINDLIDTRSQNATDAASLGLDVNSTAGALFDAQLRQALEGSSLADLGALLSSGQIVDEGARAIVEAVLAEEALAAIRVEEVAGMQELYAATEQFASAAKNNARTLRQAADALLVDPNLSPLSPELRLQEARRQFEEAFSLANDADPTDELSQDAIQRLPGLSQTMLEASRAYYGSTEGYLADFNRAQDVLNNTALRQESVEQQQLDALRDIEAAIAAAGGSVVGRTPAEQAAASGFNFGGETERNQNIYNALVAAGLPTPQGFGGSVSGNLGQLRAANPAVDALVSAMGFATGGSFTVAGPAGNDNLLMPLRLTAGEAVNVSRGDSMAAMSQRLESLVSLQAESNQINKALLHENAQQARALTKANAENAKLNRLLTDRQAAQPRVAYR